MEIRSITAIIVLYHSKHLLPKIIENITLRIVDLNEIILVDNSKEDLSKFKNDIIKIIHPKKNIGYGAAINLGISAAKNDIIIAMNPDIEITNFNIPKFISSENFFIASGVPSEWKTIRKFPSINYDMLHFLLQKLAKPFHWINRFSGCIQLDNLTSFKKVDWVSGSLIVTNKNTMNLLSGFDEGYFLFYEEVDLCRRASQKNIPRFIIPEILFNLNSGTSSSISVSDIKCSSEIKSAKRYHTKYRGKFVTNFYFRILKILCYLIALFLSFINIILSRKKIQRKAKHYFITAKSI